MGHSTTSQWRRTVYHQQNPVQILGVIIYSAVSHQAFYSSQTLITLVTGRIKTIFLVMSREFLLTHDIRLGLCFPKYTIFLLSYGGHFPQQDLNGNVSNHVMQVP